MFPDYVFVVTEVKSAYPCDILLGVFDSYDAIIYYWPETEWQRGEEYLIDKSGRFEVDRLRLNKRYDSTEQSAG